MRTGVVLLAAVLVLAPATLANADTTCAPEPVHAYTANGSAVARAAGMGLGVLYVWATDSNALDCDGDGVAGDWDGDAEMGWGGGIFGWGPWAQDPTCGFDYNVHGPWVRVTDAVFADVAFVIAEDDQDGPQRVTDPLTGETRCATDGLISPDTDEDDCATPVLLNEGRTCGTGGGDGVFYVFLWTEATDQPFVGTPTTGTIWAGPEP